MKVNRAPRVFVFHPALWQEILAKRYVGGNDHALILVVVASVIEPIDLSQQVFDGLPCRPIPELWHEPLMGRGAGHVVRPAKRVFCNLAHKIQKPLERNPIVTIRTKVRSASTITTAIANATTFNSPFIAQAAGQLTARQATASTRDERLPPRSRPSAQATKPAASRG